MTPRQLGLVAIVAAACAGDPDPPQELDPLPPQCTDFDVLVTVYTPMGELVDDADVEYTVVLGGTVTDTPCDSNGDGTYWCVGNVASTNQQVSAFPSVTGTYDLQAAAVKVDAPDHCGEMVEVTLYLAPDGMA